MFLLYAKYKSSASHKSAAHMLIITQKSENLTSKISNVQKWQFLMPNAKGKAQYHINCNITLVYYLQKQMMNKVKFLIMCLLYMKLNIKTTAKYKSSALNISTASVTIWPSTMIMKQCSLAMFLFQHSMYWVWAFLVVGQIARC